MTIRRTFSFFLLTVEAARALPSGSWYRYAEESLRKPASGSFQDDSSTHWFTQRLDHFDRQVHATWQQRSFQNATFFDGTGPVFLCVGGEGPPLDPSVLIASPHCSDMVELAPTVGALMVAVEHRFYGASLPMGRRFSREALRFLSSQQALEDLAEFHAQVVANYSLSEANKWVSFGGSYPGMLAGFFRLKYPHLVHAAVSSSSPWQAKLDMQEYQDIVGDSLAMVSVGGSAACQRVVVDGHAEVAALLATPQGRAALADAFGLCDPGALATEAVAGEWAGGGVIDVPSQGNDPGCGDPACDIGRICTMLLEPAPAVAAASDESGGGGGGGGGEMLGADVWALARVAAAQRGGAGRCVAGWSPAAMHVAWARALEDEASPARSWLYQTCTEFGFYQTCEYGSRCPFAQGYQNLSQAMAPCGPLFGLAAADVARQVAQTNLAYGGAAGGAQASRTLFPNGEVDPWRGLGVLPAPGGAGGCPGDVKDDTDAPCAAFVVPGASHHAWTHPARDIVQASVAEAKAAIQAQVVAWLAED